jgi:hypothetical protein
MDVKQFVCYLTLARETRTNIFNYPIVALNIWGYHQGKFFFSMRPGHFRRS